MTTSADLDSDPHTLLHLTVNHSPVVIAAPDSEPLLHVIRDRVGLTGTKSVCEMGNCGACTVLLDGIAVYSCLVLAAECEERSVETVESLADRAELSNLQQTFVDCDGLQCGFCSSGQLMSLEALRRRSGPATRDDVVDAVSGNLCRCGAYEHIIEAGLVALGAAGSDER